MGYYEILEVDKKATNEEIKRSYRRLALKWHPDKNPNNKKKAEENFKKISEAYAVLIDPSKRREYDHRGQSPFNHHFSFRTADQMFKEFFKDFGFGGFPRFGFGDSFGFDNDFFGGSGGLRREGHGVGRFGSVFNDDDFFGGFGGRRRQGLGGGGSDGSMLNDGFGNISRISSFEGFGNAGGSVGFSSSTYTSTTIDQNGEKKTVSKTTTTKLRPDGLIEKYSRTKHGDGRVENKRISYPQRTTRGNGRNRQGIAYQESPASRIGSKHPSSRFRQD